MATYRTQLASREAGDEHREDKRFVPLLLTYFSFGGRDDGGNGGMVLDASEGGLALVAALAVPTASLLSITLPADKTHQAIELRGRVVWLSESKRRIGVQLVEQSESNRERMRKWISAMGELTSQAASAIPALSIQAISDAHHFPPASAVIFEGRLASTAAASSTSSTRDESANFNLEDFIEQRQLCPSLAVMGAPRPPNEMAERAANGLGNNSEKPVRTAPVTNPTGGASGPWSSPSPTISAAHRRPTSARPPSVTRRPLLLTATVVMASFVFVVFLHHIPAAGLQDAQAGIMGRSSDFHQPAIAEIPKADSTSIATSNVAASAMPISDPVAADPVPAAARTPAESTASAKPRAPTAEHVATVSQLDASASGEIFVTPNADDTPVRVELPEDVIVHTVWLEIRSQRSAMVPGTALPGHYRPRRARLVVGLLDSPVTPQPPTAAYQAAGMQNAEQVVAVRATIGGDGHVLSVDPISGPDALMPSITAAVRLWQYEPSSLNRLPIETTADLTFKFRPIR